MSKTIRFKKENGEIQYKQYLLNNLENALSTIANGEYLLLIKKEVKKRSLDQNALMWLWFSCIEQETGTDKNDVHDWYCGCFLGRKAVINGEEKTVAGGTSRLTTEQFTYFLDRVQSDAASEFGIRLPNPEDAYFESFEQEYKRYINI
jgi:hypothetical protein